MSHKAQLNSIDFISATALFVIVLSFLLYFWSSTILESDSQIERNKLESTALAISDLFVKSPGVPSNWESNPSTVQSLGLVYSQNILSKNKLANFTAMNYTNAKELLGLQYEMYFYVENLSKNKLYEFGNRSSSTDNQRASVIRIAILDGQKVRMIVMVHD